MVKGRLSAGDRTSGVFQLLSKKPAKRPSPKRRAGTFPRSFIVPFYVNCFATTRQSNTNPNVAAVAAMLSVVPIIVDRTGDRDCAGGGFFAFCFFVAIAESCWVRSLDLTLTLPVGFCFPIVGRTVPRGASELLKADGKPKMTPCNGLRIDRRDRASGALSRS